MFVLFGGRGVVLCRVGCCLFCLGGVGVVLCRVGCCLFCLGGVGVVLCRVGATHAWARPLVSLWK